MRSPQSHSRRRWGPGSSPGRLGPAPGGPWRLPDSSGVKSSTDGMTLAQGLAQQGGLRRPLLLPRNLPPSSLLLVPPQIMFLPKPATHTLVSFQPVSLRLDFLTARVRASATHLGAYSLLKDAPIPARNKHVKAPTPPPPAAEADPRSLGPVGSKPGPPHVRTGPISQHGGQHGPSQPWLNAPGYCRAHPGGTGGRLGWALRVRTGPWGRGAGGLPA